MSRRPRQTPAVWVEPACARQGDPRRGVQAPQALAGPAQQERAVGCWEARAPRNRRQAIGATERPDVPASTRSSLLRLLGIQARERRDLLLSSLGHPTLPGAVPSVARDPRLLLLSNWGEAASRKAIATRWVLLTRRGARPLAAIRCPAGPEQCRRRQLVFDGAVSNVTVVPTADCTKASGMARAIAWTAFQPEQCAGRTRSTRAARNASTVGWMRASNSPPVRCRPPRKPAMRASPVRRCA